MTSLIQPAHLLRTLTIWIVAVVLALLAGVAESGISAVTTGDIDGDGARDSVRLAWPEPDGRPPTRCRSRPDSGYKACGLEPSIKLVAHLTRLGWQRIRVPVTIVDARILGIVDVDRDGRGEVFVEVAHGASTAFFMVLRLVGDRLVPMTTGGPPTACPLGGSVTHFAVMGCTKGALVIGGWGNDATSASGSFTAYHLDGARFVVERTSSFDWTCPVGNDDRMQCATAEQLAATGLDLDCPDLPFN